MVPSYLRTGLPLGVSNRTEGPSPAALLLYTLPFSCRLPRLWKGHMSNLLRTPCINDLYQKEVVRFFGK